MLTPSGPFWSLTDCIHHSHPDGETGVCIHGHIFNYNSTREQHKTSLGRASFFSAKDLHTIQSRHTANIGRCMICNQLCFQSSRITHAENSHSVHQTGVDLQLMTSVNLYANRFFFWFHVLNITQNSLTGNRDGSEIVIKFHYSVNLKAPQYLGGSNNSQMAFLCSSADTRQNLDLKTHTSAVLQHHQRFDFKWDENSLKFIDCLRVLNCSTACQDEDGAGSHHQKTHTLEPPRNNKETHTHC